MKKDFLIEMHGGVSFCVFLFENNLVLLLYYNSLIDLWLFYYDPPSIPVEKMKIDPILNLAPGANTRFKFGHRKMV